MNLLFKATCPHFPACGGCVAQDMDADSYRAWKEEKITGALRRHGITARLDEFISCAPHSRRRVTLAFERSENSLPHRGRVRVGAMIDNAATHSPPPDLPKASRIHPTCPRKIETRASPSFVGGGNIMLGFHAARSHDIVPIETCVVAVPEIVSALPHMRKLLGALVPKNKEASVTVLASETGLDISINDVAPLSLGQKEQLVAAARGFNLARLTINGDILVSFSDPVLKIGDISLTPPPGGFVQAVAAAEDAMAERIGELLKKRKAKRVADLFCGAGAFTLRMAKISSVHAVENDGASLDALQHAYHHAQKLKPVSVEKRDLFRRPLLPHELNPYDAVILDPPRQGAQAQCIEIAKSKTPLVIYVSCNPGSFARDARILTKAGYKIESLVAIDQFLWSEHIETIAVIRF